MFQFQRIVKPAADDNQELSFDETKQIFADLLSKFQIWD